MPEYECPNCYRWAPWTDGELEADGDGPDTYWCQTCGAETPVAAMASRNLASTGPGGNRA
ncbi:hypothetical protein [Glycomyces sp. YM15]|uniref:hypothetical protein n=1 Tax=Glycomyces sp. YM15 TaxID=2800446 RepID=UPI0019647344|nr:hypothetical protein [Glycomyces sp. YM15]